MAASMGRRAEAAWMPGVTVDEDANLAKVHETMTEVIKQVANEPSVGLFFVQQHVHKAVPVLVSLKSQLVEITQEANLYTEDARDALKTVKVMKDCGPSTVERMTKILASSTSILPSLHRGKSTGPSIAISAGGQEAGYLERLSLLRTGSRPIEFPPGKGTAGTSSGQHAASDSSSSPELTVPHLIDPMMTNRHGTGYIWTVLDSAMSTAGNVTSGVRRLTSGAEAGPVEYPPNKPASGYVSSVLSSAFQRASNRNYASPSDSLTVTSSSGGSNDAEASTSSGRSAVPTGYMRAVYDTAVQTAGTVGREGSRLFKLGSKSNASPSSIATDEAEPAQPEPIRPDAESYDEFQAGQAAQFEVWLGDSGGSDACMNEFGRSDYPCWAIFFAGGRKGERHTPRDLLCKRPCSYADANCRKLFALGKQAPGTAADRLAEVASDYNAGMKQGHTPKTLEQIKNKWENLNECNTVKDYSGVREDYFSLDLDQKKAAKSQFLANLALHVDEDVYNAWIEVALTWAGGKAVPATFVFDSDRSTCVNYDNLPQEEPAVQVQRLVLARFHLM